MTTTTMTKCCQIDFTIEETSLNFCIENTSIDFNADLGYLKSDIADYSLLTNKPQINDVTLIGNKSFEELGIQTMTNLEIKEIFDRVFKGGN